MDDTIHIHYADLLLWLAIMLGSFLVVFILIFHLHELKDFAKQYILLGIYKLVSTFFTFAACVLCTAGNMLLTIAEAREHLPYAWYVFTVLTVLPICIPIPQSFAVVYLAAYCVVGLCICVCTPLPARPTVKAEHQTHSQFFSGLRITIP
jgi:hypothetical protein